MHWGVYVPINTYKCIHAHTQERERERERERGSRWAKPSGLEAEDASNRAVHVVDVDALQVDLWGFTVPERWETRTLLATS